MIDRLPRRIRRRRSRPLGEAVLRGLVAGAAGTAVMTLVQTAYLKAQGAEGSEVPAEAAEKVVETAGGEVPEERKGLLNTVMHAAYGTGWGAVYGIAHERLRGSTARDGALFSGVVWGASLVELPLMGLAPPPWRYSPKQIAPDVGFHALYGAATAAAYDALPDGALV